MKKNMLGAHHAARLLARAVIITIAWLVALTPVSHARDNRTPLATPLTSEQLIARLKQNSQQLNALTPRVSPKLTSMRDAVLLTTVPPEKHVGAYDISGIAALASVTDQLSCKVTGVSDCEKLPVADQAAPFAMSFPKGIGTDTRSYTEVAFGRWGPVEGQQTISEAAIGLFRTGFMRINWACVKPNDLFTPLEGTSVAKREKIEEFGRFFLPLRQAVVVDKTMTWDDAQKQIAPKLNALLGRKPDDKPYLSRRALANGSPVSYLAVSQLVSQDHCDSANENSGYAKKLDDAVLGVFWWPRSTHPTGAQDQSAYPLLTALLKDNVSPMLEVCASAEDKVGRCERTLTFAVTGTARFCNASGATCTRALRMVNTFDKDWGDQHPNGWVDFEAIARRLHAAPLRDSTIAWFQSQNVNGWRAVPGVIDRVMGTFGSGYRASAAGKKADEELFAEFRHDKSGDSVEQIVKAKSNAPNAQAMAALAPIDFTRYEIKPGTLLELKNIPPDRLQGVMGICYSASASAQADQLYCRENGIANCQSLPPEQKASVVTGWSRNWRDGKLVEGGNAYGLMDTKAIGMFFNKEACVRPSMLFRHEATESSLRQFLEFAAYYRQTAQQYVEADATKRTAMLPAIRTRVKQSLDIDINVDDLSNAMQPRNAEGSALGFDDFLFRVLVKEDCYQDMVSKAPMFTHTKDGATSIEGSRDAKRWPRDDRELADMSKFEPLLAFLLQNNIMPEVSVCMADNAQYGSCADGQGHSWTVTATAQICAKDGASPCFAGARMLNWWGAEWQSERNGGWIRMSVLKSLAATRAGPVSWIQSKRTHDPSLPKELEN